MSKMPQSNTTSLREEIVIKSPNGSCKNEIESGRARLRLAVTEEIGPFRVDSNNSTSELSNMGKRGQIGDGHGVSWSTCTIVRYSSTVRCNARFHRACHRLS